MQEIPSGLVSPLLQWYAENRRELPWRADTQPYHVWLSEIMLQQTRVEAVKSYYLRFLQELPDVQALARCSEQRLEKLWEGLGYYTRMRNLHKTAKIIAERYGGSFPADYDSLRALPGVGEYTAGAIGSICFSLTTPAVDGNVLRVASRILNDSRSIGSAQIRKEYRQALQRLYTPQNAGALTQALMELGATLCGPNALPECQRCPVRELCEGCRAGSAAELPHREEKKPRQTEKLTVFLLTCGERLAVRRRADSGLLAGLWELPNVPGWLETDEALSHLRQMGVEAAELIKRTEKTHVFTHRIWQMRCYQIECAAAEGELVWADRQQRRTEVALPSAFRIFL